MAAEVPKSPYIAIVYRYADEKIKNDPDKHVFGANDLRVLYTLSELSNKPQYRDAADAWLKRFMRNVPDVPEVRSRSWNWMFWDRCFQVAPEDSRFIASRSASMRALAAVYQQTKKDEFLNRLEASLIPGETATDQIALAIDAWGVASRLPEPLAGKLRKFARSQDEAFLSHHELLERNKWHTGDPLTADLAMLCVSRYENCGDIRYRDLIIAAADFYRTTPPDTEFEIRPITFGHIISLELAAWRSAAKQEYLDSARKFADIAVKKFWPGNDPLPTGTQPAGSLVLALTELHLSILHITAVRCPPNTIDR